jgi:hypothetical protein
MLERAFPSVAIPDADGLFDREHEDLAVTDLSRAGGVSQRLEDLVQPFVRSN